jgi:hypothetical protein
VAESSVFVVDVGDAVLWSRGHVSSRKALAGLIGLIGFAWQRRAQLRSIHTKFLDIAYGKLPELVLWAVRIRTLSLVIGVAVFPNFVSTAARHLPKNKIQTEKHAFFTS